MQNIRSVATYVPAKVRGVIYTVLGTAIALEAVWGVIPEQVEAKALTTLSILGFGLALGNVGD